MIFMRRVLPISFCILHSAFCISSAFAAAAGADPTSPIPAALPSSRYEKMSQKSPFAPATAAATPPAALPDFAANLYVSGLAKLGDKDFVTIQSRDGNARYSLATGEQAPDGTTLVKVDWLSDVGKSKVTVKKGAETGTLSFDQAMQQNTAAMPPASGGAPPRVGQPAAYRVNVGQPNQPRAMQIPQPPQPVNRGINVPPILQNTSPTTAQPQGANPNGQPQPDLRRRSRIILNTP